MKTNNTGEQLKEAARKAAHDAYDIINSDGHPPDEIGVYEGLFEAGVKFVASQHIEEKNPEVFQNAVDKCKAYLNSIINQVPEEIHEKFWQLHMDLNLSARQVFNYFNKLIEEKRGMVWVKVFYKEEKVIGLPPADRLEILIKWDDNRQVGDSNLILELLENGWLDIEWLDERESPTANTETARQTPLWYTVDQMYDYLIRMKRSSGFAKMLAVQYAENLQGAFKKGWEKGKNDKRPVGDEYEYMPRLTANTEGQPDVYVVKYDKKPTNYPAECESCGWMGSNEELEGGHAIADTGDYSDPLCPVCMGNEIGETEERHDLASISEKYAKALKCAKYFREAYERTAEESYAKSLQTDDRAEHALLFAEYLRAEEWEPTPKEMGMWYRRLERGKIERKHTSELYAQWPDRDKGGDLDFKSIVSEWMDWTRNTFAKSTAASSLIHLQREIKELLEELDGDAPNLRQEEGAMSLIEYADCIICLLTSAGKLGFDGGQILKAISNKMQINYQREWTDNGDGTYSHKK